jgi:hypothetical protein
VLPLEDPCQPRWKLQRVSVSVGPGKFKKVDLVIHVADEPLDQRREGFLDVLLLVDWVFGSQGLPSVLPQSAVDKQPFSWRGQGISSRVMNMLSGWFPHRLNRK